MPYAPQTICPRLGCQRLGKHRHSAPRVRWQSREAERRYDKARGSSTARGYDRRWRRLRLLILHQQPICAACGRAPATEVDHIQPRRIGGIDAPDNLQGLCKPCHSAKTTHEDKDAAGVMVISGPPGAGKTTLVKQRMQRGDLVVDLDAIMSALSGQPEHRAPAELLRFGLVARDAVLNAIRYRPFHGRAWIITTAPPQEATQLAEDTKGTVELIATPAATCKARLHAAKRSDIEDLCGKVDFWWQNRAE